MTQNVRIKKLKQTTSTVPHFEIIYLSIVASDQKCSAFEVVNEHVLYFQAPPLIPETLWMDIERRPSASCGKSSLLFMCVSDLVVLAVYRVASSFWELWIDHCFSICSGGADFKRGAAEG